VYERGGSISHDFLLIRRLEIIFFNYVDVCWLDFVDVFCEVHIPFVK
jgi:hypothetical protein